MNFTIVHQNWLKLRKHQPLSNFRHLWEKAKSGRWCSVVHWLTFSYAKFQSQNHLSLVEILTQIWTATLNTVRKVFYSWAEDLLFQVATTSSSLKQIKSNYLMSKLQSSPSSAPFAATFSTRAITVTHTCIIIDNDLYKELLGYAKHLSINIPIRSYSKNMVKPSDLGK